MIVLHVHYYNKVFRLNSDLSFPPPPIFLSGRFLRKDLMDLLEIFRVDVKVNEVVLFFIRQKIHFRSVKMAVFRGFF